MTVSDCASVGLSECMCSSGGQGGGLGGAGGWGGGGTRSPVCNAITGEFGIGVDYMIIGFSPTHISGKHTVVADRLSEQQVRNDLNIAEWALGQGTASVWSVCGQSERQIFFSCSFPSYVSGFTILGEIFAYVTVFVCLFFLSHH